MDKASEAILALKPVTFHYKHELDPDGSPQFGLVAEEVAKVRPDLVAGDDYPGWVAFECGVKGRLDLLQPDTCRSDLHLLSVAQVG
jgi:hypothetical protein